jgi:NitT/TauT family transport system substrate-binding protein
MGVLRHFAIQQLMGVGPQVRANLPAGYTGGLSEHRLSDSARASGPPSHIRRTVLSWGLLALVMLPAAGHGREIPTPSNPVFTVGWSSYPGSEPYPYLEGSGVLKKWADRYHVEIKLRHFDSGASIEAYSGKNVDACAMTNLDTLTSAAGTDSTVLFVSDASAGADMILARNGVGLKTLAGKKVVRVQKSMSDYLLTRAVELQGTPEQLPQVKLVNATSGNIVKMFLADPSIDVAVTWKPLSDQILAGGEVQSIFSTAQIPGAIAHFLVVRNEVLNKPDGSGDRFAKALTGAWYEVMGLMTKQAGEGDVMTAMAADSKETLDAFRDLISTTQLFPNPRTALHFVNGEEGRRSMQLIRLYCFSHKLLGAHTESPEDVAIEYPDKTIQGKPDHVRLRFESKYMLLASGRML